MLVHSDSDSFLNSSLTYSPSPTAEKETAGRNMEEIIATSIAFNFDSTDDPDPLSLTERTDALGNREKSEFDSHKTVDSKLGGGVLALAVGLLLLVVVHFPADFVPRFTVVEATARRQ
jgi:hypothetical protein